MTQRLGSAIAAVCLAAVPAWAQQNPLKQATFTQVVNRVEVLSGGGQSAAKVGATFRAPETLRTGAQARCELKASDDTLTRIGANTIFRYGEEPRTIFLEQGNVLFYSPTGKGGGTIKTASASAGVLGSTNMVSTTSNGGFKVLGLEHRTKVSFNLIKNIFGAPKSRILSPGQMTFVLPGATQMPPVFEFRLGALVQGSELLNGFAQQLPSMPAILENAAQQEQAIAKGKKDATSKLIGDVDESGQLNLIDANSRQAFFVQQQEETADDIFGALLQDLYLTSPEIPDEFEFSGEEVQELFSALGINDSILPSGTKFSFNNLGGVAARNIFFQTPTVDLGTLTGSSAGFYAAEDINIQQSVLFTNFTGPLGLLADDGQVSIAENSVVEYNGGDFLIRSGNSFNVTNVTFAAATGGIFLQAANGDLNINQTLTDFSTFSTGDDASNQNPASTPINLHAVNGNINIYGPGNGYQIEFPSTDISMAARTIVLDHVNFPAAAIVNLYSEMGMLAPNPNTGAAAVPGYVNFISGVFKDGSPAQFFVPTSVGGSASPGNEEIFIHQLSQLP